MEGRGDRRRVREVHNEDEDRDRVLLVAAAARGAEGHALLVELGDQRPADHAGRAGNEDHFLSLKVPMVHLRRQPSDPPWAAPSQSPPQRSRPQSSVARPWTARRSVVKVPVNRALAIGREAAIVTRVYRLDWLRP